MGVCGIASLFFAIFMWVYDIKHGNKLDLVQGEYDKGKTKASVKASVKRSGMSFAR